MAELLKNVYTKEYISTLADKIKECESTFNKEDFINNIFDSSWNNMELKNRMRHIALSLNKFLPFHYEKQIQILKEVSKSFSGFEAMFFQDFVEVYGLNDFDTSMDALGTFTIDSSSEFAIRQFLLKYEEKTLKQMKKWINSSNEHHRRLASEGCRPRLPWAIALEKYKKDPKEVLEIIELLKNDSSKYVQKSLANNLNDISKDNPKFVVNFVRNNLGMSETLNWICKHASRTLLKKGNIEILELFNYKQTNHVKIKNFFLEEKVKLGDTLNFSFELQSDKSLGNLRVEYGIYYLKANNSFSRKMFMIFQNEIKQKQKEFIKRQSFKEMTTRKHYCGKHFLSIIINGKELEKKEFELIK